MSRKKNKTTIALQAAADHVAPSLCEGANIRTVPVHCALRWALRAARWQKGFPLYQQQGGNSSPTVTAHGTEGGDPCHVPIIPSPSSAGAAVTPSWVPLPTALGRSSIQLTTANGNIPTACSLHGSHAAPQRSGGVRRPTDSVERYWVRKVIPDALPSRTESGAPSLRNTLEETQNTNEPESLLDRTAKQAIAHQQKEVHQEAYLQPNETL